MNACNQLVPALDTAQRPNLTSRPSLPTSVIVIKAVLWANLG